MQDRNDYSAMARYAIEEWRKNDVVLHVGESYYSKKYEYNLESLDGRRAIISMIPFSIEALGLNASDLEERAKAHPLYELIVDLKPARG
jgi:hypothetical protein